MSRTGKILASTVLLLLLVLIAITWNDLVAGLATKIPFLPEQAASTVAQVILVGSLQLLSRVVVLLLEVKIDPPFEVAA
jgi:hypothetical protein